MSTTERLYQLLPSIIRYHDVLQGEPLRALALLLQEEMDAIDEETVQTYENWFIETAEEWAVPYIGDLLGVAPIRTIPEGGFSARAYVGNTMAYRKRKGTAAVLEQVARDVTG